MIDEFDQQSGYASAAKEGGVVEKPVQGNNLNEEHVEDAINPCDEDEDEDEDEGEDVDDEDDDLSSGWTCPICLADLIPWEEVVCEHVVAHGGGDCLQDAFPSATSLACSACESGVEEYVIANAPQNIVEVVRAASGDCNYWHDRANLTEFYEDTAGYVADGYWCHVSPDDLSWVDEEAQEALDWIEEHWDVIEEADEGTWVGNSEDKVCPSEGHWASTYNKLKRAADELGIPQPPLAPIWNGDWTSTSDYEKHRRWQDTLRWAGDHGLMDQIPVLERRAWHYVQVWMGKPIGSRASYAQTAPPSAISLFLHRLSEPEPRLHNVPFVHDADLYFGRLQQCVKFSGSASDAAIYLDRHPFLRLNGRLSSVYIAPEGAAHVLNPHQHNETAVKVLLQPNLPEGYAAVGQTIPRSPDLRNTAMARFLGLMRAQFLVNGVGMTVEMSRPPTVAQVFTALDYYHTTDMQTFVAEVNWHGAVLARVTNPDDLCRLLSSFDPFVEDAQYEMNTLIRSLVSTLPSGLAAS